MRNFLRSALLALLFALPIGVIFAQSNPNLLEYAQNASTAQFINNEGQVIGQGYLVQEDESVRLYTTRKVINDPWALEVWIHSLTPDKLDVVDEDFICEGALEDTGSPCYFELSDEDAELVEYGLVPLIPFVREYSVIEKGSFLLSPNDEYAGWVKFKVLEVTDDELVVVPVMANGLLDESGLFCPHNSGAPLMLTDATRTYTPILSNEALPIIVGTMVAGEGKSYTQYSQMFDDETCYAKVIVDRVQEQR